MASSVTKQESLSVVVPDGLNLRKAQSAVIHEQLKQATEYALSQSLTKWLLIEDNNKLLKSKFICIRWSQTKGFIVLKKYCPKNKNKDAILSSPSSPNSDKENFLLYVDLLGAMQSYIKSHDNYDINEWLGKNFALNSNSKNNQKNDKNNNNDDEKKEDEEDHHKIITLQALYNILKSNWGEKNIKVVDRKNVNGVIEFRISDHESKKKMNSFYQSLSSLYNLLEDEEVHEQHTICMDEWGKDSLVNLPLQEDIGVDVSLTMDPRDDSLISGHIFLISNSLFLTVQYGITDKVQVKFAKSLMAKFGLNADIIDGDHKDAKELKMEEVMKAIQGLLKENGLEIHVSDEYMKHQEILFVVKKKSK